jgi:hypothetical protein
MLATAVNPSVSLLFRGTTFPVKSRKIPCSQGISTGASGIRCYLLHFGNRIERYQWVGPDLFSLHARARERAAAKRGGGKWALRKAMPVPASSGMLRCRPF